MRRRWRRRSTACSTFFDDEQGAVIAAELDLLAAIRDNAVRQLLLRAADLSPEALRTSAT